MLLVMTWLDASHAMGSVLIHSNGKTSTARVSNPGVVAHLDPNMPCKSSAARSGPVSPDKASTNRPQGAIRRGGDGATTAGSLRTGFGGSRLTLIV